MTQGISFRKILFGGTPADGNTCRLTQGAVGISIQHGDTEYFEKSAVDPHHVMLLDVFVSVSAFYQIGTIAAKPHSGLYFRIVLLHGACHGRRTKGHVNMIAGKPDFVMKPVNTVGPGVVRIVVKFVNDESTIIRHAATPIASPAMLMRE